MIKRFQIIAAGIVLMFSLTDSAIARDDGTPSDTVFLTKTERREVAHAISGKLLTSETAYCKELTQVSEGLSELWIEITGIENLPETNSYKVTAICEIYNETNEITLEDYWEYFIVKRDENKNWQVEVVRMENNPL